MFDKFTIDFSTNVFHELSTNTKFENITKGRLGAVLVDYKNELIPIVRTTTKYNNSVQKMTNIHYEIMNKIKEFNKDVEFNNALIEIYNNTYTKMGFHSDQSLDLYDNSYIAIFSCYDNPINMRTLEIKNKLTMENYEITLDNNSVVLFSTKTNNEYLHKIVLKNNSINNKWLGLTFRLSKTFVKFINDVPFINETILNLANENETKEFYKHRSIENANIGYVYPQLNYTISGSDLLNL